MHEKVAFGVLIGIGVTLVMLGFFGCFFTNYYVDRLSYMFESVGIDPSSHYLIADLNKLMQTYVLLIMVGFLSLLGGEYVLKRGKKEKVETW